MGGECAGGNRSSDQVIQDLRVFKSFASLPAISNRQQRGVNLVFARGVLQVLVLEKEAANRDAIGVMLHYRPHFPYRS